MESQSTRLRKYQGVRLVFPKRAQFADQASFNAAWAQFIAQLPERMDLVDLPKHQDIITRMRSTRPILFMPIDVMDLQRNWKYQMLLIGIVRGGAKAIVLVEGIEPRFDVRVPPGISADGFRSLLLDWYKENVNRPSRTEVIELYPPKEFSEKAIPYIRVYNDNLHKRNGQLKWTHENAFVYYDDVHKVNASVFLETANNDKTCYYRLISRENKLQLAAWMMLSNYVDMRKTGEDFGKANIPVVIRVKLSDICEPATHRTEPINPADHRDLVRDPAVIMLWDLETYSIKSTGDAPQVERVYNVQGKEEDIIIMQSMLFSYHHDDEILVRLSFTDMCSPMVADCTVIQVTCQADIIQVKAIMMERMKMDYVAGFNDSAYDWPFIFRRAEALDKQGYKLCKELKERPCVLNVTEDLRKWVLRDAFDASINVKIDADTNVNVEFLHVPGFICLDTRVVFRQMYPNMENVSSLNSFLEANKIGRKEDMPYQTMFKIYRMMRQLAHDLGTSVYEEILACLEEWQVKHGPMYRPFEGIDLEDNPFERIDASEYNIKELTIDEVIVLAKMSEQVVRYCNVDAQRCQELLKKRNIIADKRETANLTFVSTFDALYRAGGMKVRNKIMAKATQADWRIAFSNVTRDKIKSTKKFPGAYVIPPKKGLYRDHKWMKAARLLSLHRPDLFRAVFGALIEKAKAAGSENPERPLDEWVNPQSPDFQPIIREICDALQVKLYRAIERMPSNRQKTEEVSTSSKDARSSIIEVEDSGVRRESDVKEVGVRREDSGVRRESDVNQETPKLVKTPASGSKPGKVIEVDVSPAIAKALLAGQAPKTPNAKLGSSVPLRVDTANTTAADQALKRKARIAELDKLLEDRPVRIRLPKPATNVEDAMTEIMREIMAGPDFTVNQVEEIERNNDVFPRTDRPNSGLDHSSLYPNIIITFNLSPEKCIRNRKQMESLLGKKDKYGNPYRFREIVFHYKNKDEPKGPENEIRAWFVQYTPVEAVDPKTGKKSFVRFDGMGIYPAVLKELFDMRVGLKAGLGKFGLPQEFLNSMVNEREKNRLPNLDSLPIPEQRAQVLKAAEVELKNREAKFAETKKKLSEEKIHHMKKIIDFIKNEWDVLGEKGNYPEVEYPHVCTEKCDVVCELEDTVKKFRAMPFSKFLDEVAFNYNYFNAKQLAIKLIMNTAYGETGFNISPFFLVEVAGAVTFMGQCMLKLPKAYITDKDFDVVYGDTDSLYCSPPDSEYTEIDKLFESGQISKLEWWYRMADHSMDVMDRCRDEVNEMLYDYTGTRFLSMAYEEVLWPYMMVGKKKYVGLKHEGIVDLTICKPECTFEKFAKDKLVFVRGLELKKRGSSEVLKTCCMEVVWRSFNVAESRTLREICEDKLKEVKTRPWNPRMFVKTVKYKERGFKPTGELRNGNVKVQDFMARMKQVQQEHPELGIRVAELGERFEFIIVERYPHAYNIRGVSQSLGMGERMEYASVVCGPKDGPEAGKPNTAYEAYLQETLRPDLDYYVENELIGQLSRFIIYHPDYDRVHEYLRDVTDDADFDDIYKKADSKAHDMAGNQLKKFYQLNYATKYRNYNSSVQGMFRGASKAISRRWEERYGEGSRILDLASKMITTANEDANKIRETFPIVELMLSDLELLASKEAEQLPMCDLRVVRKRLKMTIPEITVMYRRLLAAREARAKRRLENAKVKLAKLLPSLQDFAFRQMEWLSTSMESLMLEMKLDKRPILPDANRMAHPVKKEAPTETKTGKKKKAAAKKKPAVKTEEEIEGDKSIQVKVSVPEETIEEAVEFSLDITMAEEQEEAENIVAEVQACYSDILAAKYVYKSITYMKRTLEDMSREKNKRDSRGADPRVLAEFRRPGNAMMRDFADFLAADNTVISGPGGMKY